MARKPIPVLDVAPRTPEEYLAGLQQMLDLFLGLTSTTIAQSKSRDFQILHSIVAHTTNIASAATTLLADETTDHSTATTPLVRVALEHAMAAQWIAITPDGMNEFIKHAAFKGAKFHELSRAAALEIPEVIKEHYAKSPPVSSSKRLNEVKKMIGDLDPSGWIYLAYNALSAYVHPSSAEVVQYLDPRSEPAGLLLRPAYDKQVLLFTLAMSVCLAEAVYLDFIKGKPHKAAISKIATDLGLPLWLTADGKAPRHKARRK